MNPRGDTPTRATLNRMAPYTPGKPIWEVQREYGLDRVIKLASNENPLGPSPSALAAIRQMLPDLNRYPDHRAAALTEALAGRLGVTPSQLVVANGADELITLLSEAYLDPGDEIVVPAPSFSEYDFGALLMNAVAVQVPLRAGYAYAVSDLLDAVNPRTKLVYLCSPNNPTGTYLPRTQLRALLDALPARVLVVFDAAYAHYADADDYTDGYEMLREGRNVAILQTFSKIYGLAGIRVGYCAAPEAVVRALLQVKEPFNVNALAQAAALAALNDEAHLAASRRCNAEGRRQLREGLAALGVPTTESQANFVLAEFGPSAAEVDASLLRQGVIVRSGKGWGLPGHLRISVGTAEENAIALDCLRRAMHEVESARSS
ncbi:histidinol-phosphate transaminase [Cohnella nanjingensis]|uniref:Histidinol-phosphate aminotransferase n=1 Tax=Cohnella nanjingensis TaxID=1387779 RepID=A0A7X0RUT3_9BACL|nr:histidinol-phosphate transaminase [Cohnella nanjingensis]MBB6674087.1 histidinol-phosphate transaminase [Cohnella nanjingensis]